VSGHTAVPPRERLIVALDVPTLEEALSLVRLLVPEVVYFKVGLSLFTKVGPEGIRTLKSAAPRLFLDLKFHDIPAVVGEAARTVSLLGVDMFTVHASGGRAMMAAALEGAREGARAAGLPVPVVLGVTVLTSLDEADLASLGYAGSVEERVRSWALLAGEAGLPGLVCSAREAAGLRALLGGERVLVTPGIRGVGDLQGDQKRTATPAEALRRGSTHLVVGRPITGAADPLAAARDIGESIRQAAGA
jgi:orotidine-5'-phosphate decarboxylase